MWAANNYLQIIVRSCAKPSQSVILLQIIFCSCAKVTSLLWLLFCELEDHDCFLNLSESELTSLLDPKNSDNTKKATKVALNVFRDYLKGRKIDEDSLVALTDELKTVKRKFYAEARKKNSLLPPPKNWKQSRLSRDKTIIELLQINHLPQPSASADNWSACQWQITIFCSKWIIVN